MAYRRRHSTPRASTFKEEFHYAPPSPDDGDGIHATDSRSQPSSALPDCPDSAFHTSSKDSAAYKYTSLNIANESKGFWGILAEKAKAILEEDYGSQQFGTPSTNRVVPRTPDSAGGQLNQPYQSLEVPRKLDNPRFRKGLDALTSSLNHIGDTLGNALEEGRTIVENKTADIMQETYNLQMKRRGSSEEQKQAPAGIYDPWQKPSMQSMQPQMQTNRQTQLKATRDVAMATAAKAKLLLRELKTVKADLAFAKERCAQLEEENRILREGREKGIHPEDDDMIRFQLETLLAEKARLAHENSVYARENRFLREIVEYHQLTMQDVVYLDEGIEEVTEVGPIPAVARMLSISPPSPSSPRSSPPPPQIPLSICPSLKDETIPPVPIQPQENNDVS